MMNDPNGRRTPCKILLVLLPLNHDAAAPSPGASIPLELTCKLSTSGKNCWQRWPWPSTPCLPQRNPSSQPPSNMPRCVESRASSPLRSHCSSQSPHNLGLLPVAVARATSDISQSAISAITLLRNAVNITCCLPINHWMCDRHGLHGYPMWLCLRRVPAVCKQPLNRSNIRHMSKRQLGTKDSLKFKS